MPYYPAFDFQLTEKKVSFMGGLETYAEAETVILGVPLEATLSFRPGTRFGPQQIRNVSDSLEAYSLEQDRELAEVRFFDAGDLLLPLGNLSESLRLIETAAAQLIKDGKQPIFLGGEHLISYPLIKAVYAKHSDLVVLHFDAHADLRSDYLGQSWSHATVMRRVTEVVGGANTFQFGIRSGTREEISFARKNTNFFPDEVLAPLRAQLPHLEKRPVYLTLDIDVIDPAFAPGTGTPEPGGCNPKEIFAALHALRTMRIVGMDLVEVSPGNDHKDLTSILAAKIIREALLAFSD